MVVIGIESEVAELVPGGWVRMVGTAKKMNTETASPESSSLHL
jgi:hypothetical protein